MADYKEFITNVYHKLGIDLSLYKEAQMRRRLTSLRNKRGYRSFSTYFKAIQTDHELLREFLNRVTINVTEFYRNPKRWEVLRDKVIPELIKQNNSLNIWSAACSSGEEPYSLAIMLNEHFSHVKASILATDIDETILNRAKEGKYSEADLKNVSEQEKKKYFTFKDDTYQVNLSLKRNITFKKHDLLIDRYPSRMDLIVCRNVLIYFTDEAKEEIYQRFSETLRKDGILFVGSTEQIFQPQNYGLQLYDTFFYQKIIN